MDAALISSGNVLRRKGRAEMGSKRAARRHSRVVGMEVWEEIMLASDGFDMDVGFVSSSKVMQLNCDTTS